MVLTRSCHRSPGYAVLINASFCAVDTSVSLLELLFPTIGLVDLADIDETHIRELLTRLY